MSKDMRNYPFKAGDKLKNGIVVMVVIKGDVNDTFGGYRCRPVLGIDLTTKKMWYGKGDVICKTLDAVTDPKNFNGGKSLDIVEYLPNPEAARVYYRMPGEFTSSVASPDEFMKLAESEIEPKKRSEYIAEDKPEEPNENIESSDPDTCQGLTAKGKPCKSKPLPSTGYCHSHRGQAK